MCLMNEQHLPAADDGLKLFEFQTTRIRATLFYKMVNSWTTIFVWEIQVHPWQWVCVAPKLMLAMLALANGDGIRHGETLFFHCKMRCRSYSDCRTFCYSCVPEGTRTIHARLLVDCCTHHVELCGEQRSVMLLVCCLDMARSAQLGGQRRSANFENGWVQHRELATATLPRIEQGRVDRARWTETASVDGLPWVCVCVKSYSSQYEWDEHPSINPSYFDVNYRATLGFDPTPHWATDETDGCRCLQATDHPKFDRRITSVSFKVWLSTSKLNSGNLVLTIWLFNIAMENPL